MWGYFDYVDKSHKRCKLRLITLKYCGSPTNFINHLLGKQEAEYKQYLEDMGVEVDKYPTKTESISGSEPSGSKRGREYNCLLICNIIRTKGQVDVGDM